MNIRKREIDRTKVIEKRKICVRKNEWNRSHKKIKGGVKGELIKLEIKSTKRKNLTIRVRKEKKKTIKKKQKIEEQM